MSSLREVLMEAWRAAPDAEPEGIAAAVIGSARTRKDLAELVFPAVRDQSVFVRRALVRRDESAAFSQPGSDAIERPADAVDPIDARRRLLLTTAYAGHDSGYVTWGQMTADQHRERIDFLERKMWGIDRTVRHHRAAVKLIEEAGVSCLDDLPSIPDEFWEAA